MIELRRFALLLALVVFTACGGSDDDSTQTTPDSGTAIVGGTLTVARGQDTVRLDPQRATDGESIKIMDNCYETLVEYPLDGPGLVPGLAESWEMGADGAEYTFTLHPGIRFHDGTPCNAAAVVKTFERLMQGAADGSAPYGSSYKMITKVEALDDLRVKFTLDAPNGLFLINLAMFPASVISAQALDDLTALDTVAMVGTGPFQFSQWKRDEKLVLRRFEEYWNPEGRAKLDEVIFTVEKEATARLQLLKDGKADFADNLNFSDFANIKKSDGIRVEIQDGMNFCYLAMNNIKPPFAGNPKLRQAVAHAINKEQLIERAYAGYGLPGRNPMPPTLRIPDPKGNPLDPFHQDVGYAYDPARAAELLAESGYDTSKPIELWVGENSRPYMPRPADNAQLIKHDLEAIGLTIRIVSREWGTYLDATQKAEHQMCLLGWSTDNGDPDNFLYALLDKDNAKVGSANNVSFYRSDPLHEVLIAAQREPDGAKRVELYRRAQEIIAEDCPMVPLVYAKIAHAMRTNVHGFHQSPVNHTRLFTVYLSE